MDSNKVISGNCLEYLRNPRTKDLKLSLTFLDPPFNQGKDYRLISDQLSEKEYWDFMKRICKLTFNRTEDGGALYFMQREKNAKQVLETLDKSGWTCQNLIIWKKKTSAVPQNRKYGLNYQIIAYATKGTGPKTFNKLRINPPRLITEKYERIRGIYVTDVWDDIREMTSGYFAGDEALRDNEGNRFHKQQSPIALLLRIVLSSTKVDDLVFDPFSGTGTTLVVAKQLERRYLGIELDPENVKVIEDRLTKIRESDKVERFYKDYVHTANLDEIWHTKNKRLYDDTKNLKLID